MVMDSPATGFSRATRTPTGGDAAVLEAEFTTLLARQDSDPGAARELAMALKKPVEHSLEDLRFRPRRAAELIGPLLDAALVEHDEKRLERFKERCWRFMSIVVNPSLWTLSVKALWEGKPVWPYLEQRAGWYQVVETLLIDPSTQMVLAKADAPARRHRASDEPLDQVMGAASAQVQTSSSYLSGTDARDSQVLVLAGQRCRLAVRVYGWAPETLRPQLQTLCLAADRVLENTKATDKVRAIMLKQLSEKALIKNCPAASPWTRRTALICITMALGLFAAVCLGIGLEERRWQSAVQAFYDEPGIQVLGESSAWGRHEIYGLRDPFARSPEEVLRGRGFDPAHVTARFKPFVSADELMTQLRQSDITRAIMNLGGQAPHPVEINIAKP